MTCAICAGKLRVERTCRVCERSVCSKCSRKILGQVDVCHSCIAPDYSGRSSRDSYRAGTSMQAQTFFRLMREKEYAAMKGKTR